MVGGRGSEKERSGMSNRAEITQQLSLAFIRHFGLKDKRKYWAREVTFDYGSNHVTRVDFMRFEPVNNTAPGIEKGKFYCYEVKSSVDDFNSPNGHNFWGDYNYYIMPEAVYKIVRHNIPHHVGVLILTGANLQSVKKANRKQRDKPTLEMLFCMYRSFARDCI